MDSWQIADAILRIDKRKMYAESSCTVNGIEIQMDTWCYIVWKPTTKPMYKGESLCKIVPRSELTREQIGLILANQPWVYI